MGRAKIKNSKINNSTKIFQALRIFVNKEISELIFGLINATKILKPGGKIVVVTFHSLEDKIVKSFFNLFFPSLNNFFFHISDFFLSAIRYFFCF